jgi:eukaryotic-like serine/threonine-protein kinase
VSTPQSEDVPLPAPQRIARYEVLSELAQGGTARLFLARKSGSGELRVLKILHRHLEGHGTAATRLKREALLASHLAHSHIARVLDAGVAEGGRFFIAMEFIAGLTVREILERYTEEGELLPDKVSFTIAIQVLEALAYAHELKDEQGNALGIVHRDLSPNNIMISFNGQVKVIDFGVAKAKLDNFRTAPGRIVGTLQYMSPEQAVSRTVDGRSDLYSLSLVLYEMLAGRPAVPIDTRPVQVLRTILEESPEPLATQRGDLPPEVIEVIERGMTKQPDRRWQSAAAYAAALRQAVAPIGLSTEAEMGALLRRLFPKQTAASTAWVEYARNSETPLETERPTLPPSPSLLAPLVPAAPAPAPAPARPRQAAVTEPDRAIEDFASVKPPEDERSRVTRDLIAPERLTELELSVKRLRVLLMIVLALAMLSLGIQLAPFLQSRL